MSKAAIDVDVRVDSREVMRHWAVMRSDLRTKLVQQTTNQTLRKMKTKTSRMVRAQLALKAKRVNDREVLTLQRAQRGGGPAKLIVKHKPAGLQHYPHRFTQRGGLRVRVRAGGPFKTVAGGFQGKGAIEGLLMKRNPAKSTRRGPKPHRGGLPIEKLFASEVIDVASDDAFLAELVVFGEQEFTRELRRRMVRYAQ